MDDSVADSLTGFRFHSRCSTVTEIASVLEDRPVCRTERVESCLESGPCREVKVPICMPIVRFKDQQEEL